jgi:hypothetical protein
VKTFKRPPLDHFLVARAEACITGANAHELHALLGNYHGLCLLAADDEAMLVRVEHIERKLRAFCQTSQLAETCTGFNLSTRTAAPHF